MLENGVLCLQGSDLRFCRSQLREKRFVAFAELYNIFLQGGRMLLRSQLLLGERFRFLRKLCVLLLQLYNCVLLHLFLFLESLDVVVELDVLA